MMTDKTVFLTEEGLKKLEEELQYLETEKRAEVAARIQSAKEEGDISENAEYDDAKRMRNTMTPSTNRPLSRVAS
jgi:transcription elongation factor GreA